MAGLIPSRTRSILKRWAEGDLGALTGFTAALVRNDLASAVSLADAANLATLRELVAWMHDELPVDCWGSEAAVTAWRDRHRRHDWWQEGEADVCSLCGVVRTEAIARSACPGVAR